MKSATSFVTSIVAVVGLGFGGLHAVEAQLARLVPNLHMPSLPAGVPGLKPGVATKTKTATGLGVVAKSTAVGLGLYAGNEVANKVGDSLPGSTGIIRQTPGDCYVETPEGNVHMSCDAAKAYGQ